MCREGSLRPAGICCQVSSHPPSLRGRDTRVPGNTRHMPGTFHEEGFWQVRGPQALLLREPQALCLMPGLTSQRRAWDRVCLLAFGEDGTACHRDTPRNRCWLVLLLHTPFVPGPETLPPTLLPCPPGFQHPETLPARGLSRPRPPGRGHSQPPSSHPSLHCFILCLVSDLFPWWSEFREEGDKRPRGVEAGLLEGISGASPNPPSSWEDFPGGQDPAFFFPPHCLLAMPLLDTAAFPTTMS